MPWTLYRYILRDLLRVLVLATAVLVVLISFAVAIKPLADGLLGPWSLLKFVGYTIPRMLGFVLPFAGAFASTIVFMRLTTDNEVTAAAASGVSYGRMLLPVLGLGLALTMGLFALSHMVVPKFYRYASQTVQQDMVTALVNQLNRNRPFALDSQRAVIYADEARQQPPPRLPEASIQPSKLVELEGVAAARMDRQGRIETEATAQQASILLFRGEEQSWITMRLRNALFYNPQEDSFGQGFMEKSDLRWQIPRPFEDDPKYLSYRELERLRREPRRYDDVNQQMQALVRVLARVRLRQRIVKRLEAAEPVVLTGPREGETYVIDAPTFRQVDGELRLAGQGDRPVTVRYRRDGKPYRRYEAEAGRLTLEQDPLRELPQVALTLDRLAVHDADEASEPAEKPTMELPRMAWPGAIFSGRDIRLSQPQTLRAGELLRLAGEGAYADVSEVKQGGRLLRDQLLALAHEVQAVKHERAASAVACVLLLVLGAVLSMQLRGQMPLVVYLWSFLLAIMTLIVINSGEQMAESTHYAVAGSLIVLWSGNLALAIITGVMYCRLARH